MALAIGFSRSYSGDDSMISPFALSSLKTSWPICASSSWSGLGCLSEVTRLPLPPPQDARPVRTTRESTDTRTSLNTFMVAPFAYDVGLELNSTAQKRRWPQPNVFTLRGLTSRRVSWPRRLWLRRSRTLFHGGGATPYLGCDHDPGNSAHQH